MTRLAKIGGFLGRFLELRLRAFVYALFALNGFILGMMVHNEMSLRAIDPVSYTHLTLPTILLV